ncbi:SGNH/GDSL hydrolase family protein [Bacillus alkalicellulosilyticus]|uniref:SGNH/GDSL hydrolase family protein n=1 Tax=Alkalihalobacterium alkalicellulosilyticum TaxID=1912214 RepID=UPI000997BA97|nr:SGNH/GDSL hydrolase family protein [Bacillus alkalicellulosilyticus]
MFSNEDRILFIGDSITDCGRREDPEQVGDGYVRLIRDYYYVISPEANYTVINKGISGNRVTDLAARWNEDVIQEQPNWVSISIGVNDVWRQIDGYTGEQVLIDEFTQIYSQLLTAVKEKTKAKLILMEPTIIEEDINSKGNQLLVPYVEAVHQLAKDFDAIVVPTHQVFKSYLELNTGIQLTTDGVHMTSVGNMLMAQTWLEAVR